MMEPLIKSVATFKQDRDLTLECPVAVEFKVGGALLHGFHGSGLGGLLPIGFFLVEQQAHRAGVLPGKKSERTIGNAWIEEVVGAAVLYDRQFRADPLPFRNVLVVEVLIALD